MRRLEKILEKLLSFFLLTLRFLPTLLRSRRFFERKYSPKQKHSRNGAQGSLQTLRGSFKSKCPSS